MDHVALDSEELVNYINEKLTKELKGCDAETYTIFNVSRNMAAPFKSSYEPMVVSIGPYHWESKNEMLKYMKGCKRQFLRLVLERTGQDIRNLLTEMQYLQKKVNARYAPGFVLKDNRFIEMMLVDSFFVVEIMRVVVDGTEKWGKKQTSTKKWGGEQVKYEHPINEIRNMLSLIKQDMLLLENQLPWPLLNRAFELTSLDEDESSNGISNLADLALKFFDSPNPDFGEMHEDSRPYPYENPLHLLHLLRKSLLPPLPSDPPKPSKKQPKPKDSSSLRVKSDIALKGTKSQSEKPVRRHLSISKLVEAGVKLKSGEGSTLLNIEFENGVLTIPPLAVNDSTKMLFLNILAFERSYSLYINYITSYIRAMDGFIDSRKDVAILQDAGIITNGMGNEEEVAFLFNDLGRMIHMEWDCGYLSHLLKEVDDYYDQNHLLKKVDDYYDQKWHRWIAVFKREYLSTPWQAFGLFAGIILLVLTFVQTVYTVNSYYQPRA